MQFGRNTITDLKRMSKTPENQNYDEKGRCKLDYTQPQQITITISKPQSPKFYNEQTLFQEFKDFNNRHFHSIQRTETPQDQHQYEFSLGNNDNNSLNNRKILQKKGSSKNQLYLQSSVISRASSTRSLKTRSQILSPYYKPFELFFKYRRESPYGLQKSLMSSDKRRSLTSHSQCKDKQPNRSTSSNTVDLPPQQRTQTPSFAQGMTEFTAFKNSQSISNSNLSENTRCFQNYLNKHIKRSIKQQNQITKFSAPSFNQCSRVNKQQRFYTQNNTAQKYIILNDEEFQQSRMTDKTQSQSFCKKDNYCQTDEIENEQQQCCHIEGQRHQITRYALEKALKLSEVLMKEVQRLDRIVQNNKYQDDHSKDKENIDFAKRDLRKEIDKLNVFCNETNLEQPNIKSMKEMYTKKKRKSQNLRDQKENYLVFSSNLLADVAACVSQQQNKQIM